MPEIRPSVQCEFPAIHLTVAQTDQSSMRFWRKPAQVEEEPTGAENRRPVSWCDGCRSPIAPFIYFQNGKHYCLRCAPKVYGTMGIRSAGKRDDDLQYPSA